MNQPYLIWANYLSHSLFSLAMVAKRPPQYSFSATPATQASEQEELDNTEDDEEGGKKPAAKEVTHKPKSPPSTDDSKHRESKEATDREIEEATDRESDEATERDAALSVRVGLRQESNKKRKNAQTHQGERMIKRRNDATFIELGETVSLLVDERDQAGHTNRGMLGIVVRKSTNGSNSVVVATSSGIISKLRGELIYFAPDKYVARPNATLTDDLVRISDSVKRAGEQYSIEHLPKVTMTVAHMEKYGGSSSGRGQCRCKGGKCGSRCGCLRNQRPCSSSCSCSGHACGNDHEHKKEEEGEEEEES
jgi:hypothetical protein